MDAPLLATKLHVNTLKPGSVHRERLIGQLNEGLDRTLSLISAPAGFGKTALVSDWAAGLRSQSAGVGGDNARLAWLSLDDNDNDYVRFLSYFIASLQSTETDETRSLGSTAIDMLRPHQHPPREEVLITLLNEVSALSYKIVAILDDYQFIQTEAIHDALKFLIEHQPPQMHLALVTREDPPLPLARLRAHGAVTEIRAAALRFSPAEAAQYLNETMGLGLQADEVAAIVGRTEGWIAGLQMAALSIREQGDPSAVVRSFAGSNRYIMDYLLEEVLERQPAGVQAFLVETAILGRLNGPLCDAVTGQEASQSTLQMLEQANLFVVPLDNERYWYRYHSLFAELLELRLRQTQPEQIPTLHRRACEWYEHNGFAHQAIDHALLAEDPELAARLIRRQAEDAWQRGDARLWRWLEQLPAETVRSDPLLSMLRGFHLDLRGAAREEVERSLQDAGQAIDRLSEGAVGAASPASHGANLQGRLATFRCIIASRWGDVRGITEQAELALQCLPEGDSVWRILVDLALGNARVYAGDLNEAYRARERAVRDCEATGLVFLNVVAELSLATAARDLGLLGRAIEICRNQVQIVHEHGLSQSKLAAWSLAALGEALLESNDVERALARAEAAQQLVGRIQDVSVIAWCFRCLMRIRLSSRDLAGAEDLLQTMYRLARRSTSPSWVLSQLSIWQARVWLAQGEVAAAGRWLCERGLAPSVPDGVGYFAFLEYLTAARILMAQGRFAELAALLSRLLEIAGKSGRAASVIEILALQALCFDATGDSTRAVDRLRLALAAAEPEGFVRVFVDNGPPMARLLYEAAASRACQGYARRLLEAFPVEEADGIPPPGPSDVDSRLFEPLSERELEVLALIGQGLSNQKVGARLFISLHTVKAHTRNIYAKLRAHNRTEAVARGRAFGLLPLG